MNRHDASVVVLVALLSWCVGALAGVYYARLDLAQSMLAAANGCRDARGSFENDLLACQVRLSDALRTPTPTFLPPGPGQPGYYHNCQVWIMAPTATSTPTPTPSCDDGRIVARQRGGTSADAVTARNRNEAETLWWPYRCNNGELHFGPNYRVACDCR